MLIVYIIQTIYKRKGRRPGGAERRLEEKKMIKRGKIWKTWVL
jgi:hypothetical protein